MAIQFIDLCSGIGGFHSGLMATGHYECVGHAEIDPDAAKAYNQGYLRFLDPLSQRRVRGENGILKSVIWHIRVFRIRKNRKKQNTQKSIREILLVKKLQEKC